eukprot:TRINITY_DN14791_c0_g1_i10.p1 TRINITY_DN14791_c0_g1~~TRINITY_DN14791_c0_g1_i10.p1  ORF type:complete len:444 (+),score=32.76 TRINITY_DN14791_c0_g1_i10:193-1524(+)
MAVTLLLAALSLSTAFAIPISNTWYRAYNLNHETIQSLTSMGCFRGTYGRFGMSIFTCDAVKGESIATLPVDAPICFVEFEAGKDPLRVIASNNDAARVLWSGEHEILLTGLNGEYPTLSCGSRSDYSGAALNVIRIPRSPILPEQPLHPVSVAPDQRISNLLSGVSAIQLRKYVEQLALDFTSRNSFAASARTAVNWVQQQMEGYGFTVTQQTFRSDMCNNLIAEKRGTRDVTPWRVVVIGAHIDSRAGTSANNLTAAPGADDNASGSAMLLELARLISEKGFTTAADIRLAFWCGEEQGLLGSDAGAQSMTTNANFKIDAYFNGDMIGWNCRGSGNKTNPIAFMSGSSSAALNTECKNIIPQYLADLNIGDTSACCSDQQSFHKYGVAASGVFECPGTGVVYPNYHKADDLPNALDYDQVARFSQALYSCFLTRAVPTGPI